MYGLQLSEFLQEAFLLDLASLLALFKLHLLLSDVSLVIGDLLLSGLKQSPHRLHILMSLLERAFKLNVLARQCHRRVPVRLHLDQHLL